MGYPSGTPSAYFLVLLLVLVALFLLLREFHCWYFKINQIVKLLQLMHEDIEFMAKEVRTFRPLPPLPQPPADKPKPPPANMQAIHCPACQAEWNVPSGMLCEGSKIACPSCGQHLET